MKTLPAMLLSGSLFAWCCIPVAQAQEPAATTTTTTTTTTATGAAGSQPEMRLVSQFSTFAGSEENARSLVTGLRQGGEITLGTATAGGQPAPGTTTTFTPPTRPMGYGNVRIALALAQEQLAQSGITEPTPTQLRTALMGGTITTTTAGATGAASTSTQYPGVLQMRADGMGWGQIANSMGVKLGAVMSGRTTLQAPATSTTGTSGTATTTTTSSSGVTTAAGATSTTTQTHGRSANAPGYQRSQAGAGIVNAAGGTSAGFSASARGGGNAGVVTGASVAAGSRASAAGLANGKGHAKP